MAPKRIVWLATLIALLLVAGLDIGRGATGRRRTKPGALAVSPLSLVAPDAADAAGEITGRVTFEGTKSARAPIDMSKDPVCAARHKEPAYPEDGAVNPNGTLPNVFVYVRAGAENSSGAPPSEPVILDQRGCVYHPHVLGIMVGQKLEVISGDPTTHNIHPLPRLNQEWNQSQAPGAPPIVKTFTRPEIMIPVKCNQHPWMKAYIGVTANPFYSITGRDGRFTIKGLPAGEYTLGAWTATFGTQERKVTVGAAGPTTVDFNFK